MTFTQALAEIRKHVGDRYVGITVEATDAPRRSGETKTVEYSVYIAAGPDRDLSIFVAASTLDGAVAMALGHLRPGPAEPVAVLDAAFDLDDPRR